MTIASHPFSNDVGIKEKIEIESHLYNNVNSLFCLCAINPTFCRRAKDLQQFNSPRGMK